MIVRIKILGPGCTRCQQTAQLVRDAAFEAGVMAEIEEVTELTKIAQYGVFGTPAVVIDEKVKSLGKIPKREEILGWLKK